MPSTGVTIAVYVFVLGAALCVGFVGWFVWSCIREPPTMTYAEALGFKLEGAKARRIEWEPGRYISFDGVMQPNRRLPMRVLHEGTIGKAYATMEHDAMADDWLLL